MGNAYVPETKVWGATDTGELVATGITVMIKYVVFLAGASGNSLVIQDAAGKDAIVLTGILNQPTIFPFDGDGRKLNGLKIGTIAGGTVYIYLY